MSPEFRFSTAPSACLYLPAEVCQMSYRLMAGLGDVEYARLLNRGWRRFGYQFFRPICPACAKCRSLRVKVAEFTPNKAQRRALKANEDVQLVVRPRSVSAEHIRLYNEYHAFMAVEKGWPDGGITPEEYHNHFLGAPFAFAYDFLYFLGARLIAVGLVDVTAEASSSAYFFHDPALRSRSLGVFSMLQELEHARARHIPHHHLGYWIPECPSMRYKSAYRPLELLVGYPGDDEEPRWVPEESWQPVLNRDELGQIF